MVLQAQSQEPSFSDGQVAAQTTPYAEQLADSVYENNECSQVMFFMTWGRENGDQGNCAAFPPICTFEGMNNRLRTAYMNFADIVEGAVSPVGVAWREVRDNHPTIDLYTSDGSHPSLEGSYLACCTFYSSLFKKSCVGSTYYNGVDPVTAGILQTIASDVVLDSLDQWQQFPIDESTIADFSFGTTGMSTSFTNESLDATTYEWDFGDGNTSMDVDPLHTYGSDGNYDVTLIAYGPCDTDTITYSVTINTAGIDEVQIGYTIEKTENVYNIHFDQSIDQARSFDANGREIEVSFDNNTVQLNLDDKAQGVYVLQVMSGDRAQAIRLFR